MQEIIGDRFIDPYDLLCQESYCSVLNDQGQLLIYDGFHLSRLGAKYLAESMRASIPDVLNSWLDDDWKLRKKKAINQ